MERKGEEEEEGKGEDEDEVEEENKKEEGRDEEGRDEEGRDGDEEENEEAEGFIMGVLVTARKERKLIPESNPALSYSSLATNFFANASRT